MTVSVIVEPAGRSVVPVIVGVVSLVNAGPSMVSVGARVSMLPPSLALALPAGALTLASTLYGPSASAPGTSTA